MFSNPYYQAHMGGRPHQEKLMASLAAKGQAPTKLHTCHVCLSDHSSWQALEEHEMTPDHKAKLETFFQAAESCIDPAHGKPPILLPGETKAVTIVKDSDGLPLLALYAKFH